MLYELLFRLIRHHHRVIRSKLVNFILNVYDFKLEDRNNGQLFAESPITEYPTKDIESVNDSSRYFVLRIQNQGRSAFIGVGFADRGDSFDFNVALQVKLLIRDFSIK